MLMRLLAAVVVAVFAYLICLFVGGVLLQAVPLGVVQATGAFLETWAELIGIGFGIWYFVSGGNFFARFKKSSE